MSDGLSLNLTTPHGLGTFPGFIHPILLCTSDDLGSGMVAGQMTEFSSVVGEYGEEPPFASVSYDTTNIYVQTTSNCSCDYWMFTTRSRTIRLEQFCHRGWLPPISGHINLRTLKVK